MSTFLTTADYASLIHPDVLARVQGDASLDDCENMAVEFMRGYLSSRYQVASIFAATGADRNPILVKYGIDITLYYLYSRISPNAVPEHRKVNYDNAEQWLRRVQKAEINPPDLPRVVDGSKDYVQFGSNRKRPQHLL